MPHDSPRTTKPRPIYVKYASEIPNCKHWAIITDETVHESGYDQGDPSTSKPITQYVAYLDQGDWEAEIKERMLARNSRSTGFRALVVEVPIITTTVEVKIQ